MTERNKDQGDMQELRDLLSLQEVTPELIAQIPERLRLTPEERLETNAVALRRLLEEIKKRKR